MRNYFVLAAFFLLAGCSKSNYAKYAPIYEKESLSNIPDFSNLAYWAAHPNKKNPSDSIPKRFQKQASLYKFLAAKKRSIPFTKKWMAST